MEGPENKDRSVEPEVTEDAEHGKIVSWTDKGELRTGSAEEYRDYIEHRNDK